RPGAQRRAATRNCRPELPSGIAVQGDGPANWRMMAGRTADRMIAAFVRTALAGLLLLATGCSFYMGEPAVPHTRLRATLDGASEVPPVRTPASGYFEAVYRPSTHVLEYRLNLVRLSSPMVMGYLHGPAMPGENVAK